jgi:hypothetical protein
MQTLAAVALTVIALMSLVLPALADDLQVKLVSVTSSVQVRGPIKLVVQTDPGAICDGNIHWQYKQSLDNFPLRAKTAGDDGAITWEWKAPSAAAHGTIDITCKAGDKQGRTSVTVTVQ